MRNNSKAIDLAKNKNTYMYSNKRHLLLAALWGLIVFVINYIPQASEVSASESPNLFENPGAEKQISPESAKSTLKIIKTEYADSVPECWGAFNTSKTSIKFGASQDAHSGKFSCFLTLVDAKKKSGAPNNFVYLMIGATNGYDGSNAIKVKPNTKYAYSFWIKGNTGSIILRLFSWSSQLSLNKRFSLSGLTPSSTKPSTEVTNEWSKVAGTFRTASTVDRVAIGIQIVNAKPGQSIMADDVLISEIPRVTLRKKAGKKISVALYDAGTYKINGSTYVLKALKDAGYQCGVIDSLAPDVINKYDVVILSTTRNLSTKDSGNADLGTGEIDYVGSLLNYVDAGGGLILGHDCVGFRGVWKNPVFPSISSGNKRIESTGLRKTKKLHPVTAGVEDSFNHSYFDHITITPGDKAEVLVKDTQGASVVVAGKISRGRVVAIGYPMGLYPKDVCNELEPNEKKILLNAVKWCGSTDKYNVPQISTDIGPLYREYVMKKNTLNLKEEKRRRAELDKYSKLPPPRFDESVMWVMSYGLKSEAQIVQMVENCKKMGFTKILVQATGGLKGLFYKTDLYPGYNKGRIDVVGIVKRETEKRGMKMGLQVYPFFNGLDRSLPMTITRNERKLIDKGLVTLKETLENKKIARWNCPDNPLCRKRLFKICAELIKKYDPDELCFDFVRYPTGYNTPCYCDYSLKKKAEFSKKHPEIKPDKLDEAFARSQLVGFYTKLNEFCKKLSPKLITGCYTYRTDWVFSYPFDYHTRYVSRYLNPKWPMSRLESDTIKYSNLVKKYDPAGHFVPMLASYDRKSGARISIELKVLSSTFDKLKAKHRSFIYYDYMRFLIKNKKTGELYEDVAEAFSNSLGGTWRKTQPDGINNKKDK